MKKGEVDIITLGCSKNLVDAERLMHGIEERGYKCVHDSDTPKGEIAVINTCGFIGDAKEESIRTILQFVERKKKHQLERLYVMGCLSQRYLTELPTEIPEVDGWFGKFDYMGILNELERRNTTKGSGECGWMRSLTTPHHYAYLKISEGCNRMCSYCAIPIITGHHQSRPMEEIVDEVRWLASQGVKEVQVIAQDLSYYGTDLYKENKLAELVEKIADVEGIEWIRLHYAYPTHFPMDLLRVMRERENVCKYLDIALQHSSDHMLTLMRRHISCEEQKELIRTIRKEVPGIFLRTTLMVGHPGESEKDFEELLHFVEEMRFERMGAFAYSDEEGTYAHEHYSDDIPEAIKHRRLDRLMDLQQRIAGEVSEEQVGKEMRVIIDREEADYYVGRTEHDSPEVDPEVLIEKSKALEIGEFYQVRITRADIFELYGEV